MSISVGLFYAEGTGHLHCNEGSMIEPQYHRIFDIILI